MEITTRERDHFTEPEVKALLGLHELTLRDRLIIRIMAETGLRRRAVSWLTVKGVYDTKNDTVHPIGHTMEKGLMNG